MPEIRDPRPMNDEWLREEIADIQLMLENLEREQRRLAEQRRRYLEYLRRLETERERRVRRGR